MLRILRPGTFKATVGKDTKEARNLRSIGKERTLKIGTLREYCLSLLISGAVSKADIVISWLYAVIHEGVRRGLKMIQEKYPELILDRIYEYQGLMNEAVTASFKSARDLLKEDFDKATKNMIYGYPNSEHRRFLHFAALLVHDTMDRHQPVMNIWHELLNVTYPNIDMYQFET